MRNISIALIALLLTGALQRASALPPLPKPCPEIPAVAWWEEKARISRLPNLTAQDCDNLRAVLSLAEKLAGAAGFAPGELPLRLRPSPVANAGYLVKDSGESIAVVLNLGFINDHKPESAAMHFVLAHEIGHAVQDRESFLNDAAYNYRQLESHADLLAAQILIKAGFNTKMGIKGKEEKFSCGRIQNEAAPTRTHPSPQDRWINDLLYNSAVSAHLDRIKSLQLSGSPEDNALQLEKLYMNNSESKTFEMIASPAVFDNDGKLKITPPPQRASITNIDNKPKFPGLDKGQVPAPLASQEMPPQKNPGSPFERAVWAAWNAALAAVGDQILPHALRRLAAQACGAPDADTLASASIAALKTSNEQRVVDLRFQIAKRVPTPQVIEQFLKMPRWPSPIPDKKTESP